MIASKRPSSERRARSPGQHRPVAGEHRQRRDRGEHVGRVVAAHARHRPAEPQPRLGRADLREAVGEHAADQGALDQPVLAQRARARAARSPGSFTSTSSSMPLRRRAPRGARAPARRSSGLRAAQRPRSRAPRAAARCRPGCSVSTSSSIMSTPCRQRRIEARERVAGLDVGRALVPDAPRAPAARSRCSPAPPSQSPRRIAGAAGRRPRAGR